jgi:hypothetical protein
VETRRLAAALAEYGAEGLAIQTLTSAAASAPKDAPLLAQLAALQLQQHQPGAARTTLRRARTIDRDDEAIAGELQMTERILELDPTLEGLRLVTRTRRARLVLTAVLEEVGPCAEEAAVAPDVAEARRQLRRRTRASAEEAERDLELAARIWAAAPCRGSGPDARAVTYVLDRVAHEAQS